MLLLILGLIIFLGIHSIRIGGEGLRQRLIDRFGANGYKGLYTVLSLLGFVLIVYGYGEARMVSSNVWNPPVAMRHVASLLTLVSFVLLAAAYVPRNDIKRAVGHPMVLGVKVWALAHLLANGGVADIILFGSFLVWAVLDFMSSRRRDRAAGFKMPPDSSIVMTGLTVGIGAVAWIVFALWLHGLLIGVKPFG